MNYTHGMATLCTVLYYTFMQPKAPEAGVTRLGMEVKKEENLADWYSQVFRVHVLIFTHYTALSRC